MRILVDHTDQKMSRVFRSGLDDWLSFLQWRHHKRLMPPAIVPRPRVRNFSVTLLPELRFLASAEQREGRAFHHWDVRAADNLQQPERARHFFFTPLIA